MFLGTQAAIKVVSARLTPEAAQDFLEEARTIARLRHPNIVQVLDFGIEERVPFLVMSYATHGSLRNKHSKRSRLSEEAVLTYTKQVASALQYAHNERLIHRDIKPENMLLGDKDEVLLSDFGIAVVAHGTQSFRTQNEAGTVYYMAPEQIQGRPRFASDQYSLGVVVYEWLTGERPFTGTAMEIGMQHLTTPPKPLQEIVPSIPPTVEQVVLKALAKSTTDRFATVQEFAAALEDAIRPGRARSRNTTDFSAPSISDTRCSTCGSLVPTGAIFCATCGKPLKMADEGPVAEKNANRVMGMSQNAAGGLCYFFFLPTAIIFLIGGRKNHYVRFHSLQCLLYIIFGFVAAIFASAVSSSSGSAALFGLCGIIWLVLYIVSSVCGFSGKYFQMPVIGQIAMNYANKVPRLP